VPLRRDAWPRALAGCPIAPTMIRYGIIGTGMTGCVIGRQSLVVSRSQDRNRTTCNSLTDDQRLWSDD
jgi:hypothetical protein